MYSQAFWEENVHRPCLHIEANKSYANTFLEGDVCIAADPSEHYATGCVPTDTMGIFDHQGAQRVPPHKPPKVKHEQVDRRKGKGANGKPPPASGHYNYSVNKKNVALCMAFQTNGCDRKCRYNQAHQCATCLQTSHGASFTGCPGSTPQQTQQPIKSKGQGKQNTGKWGKGKFGGAKR